MLLSSGSFERNMMTKAGSLGLAVFWNCCVLANVRHLYYFAELGIIKILDIIDVPEITWSSVASWPRSFKSDREKLTLPLSDAERRSLNTFEIWKKLNSLLCFSRNIVSSWPWGHLVRQLWTFKSVSRWTPLGSFRALPLRKVVVHPFFVYCQFCVVVPGRREVIFQSYFHGITI